MSIQRMLQTLLAGAASLVPTSLAAAQPTPLAKTPAFEVASVRQNTNPFSGWRLIFTPDGVDGLNVTLQYAIQFAYGVYDDKLWSGGPAWLGERRFNIQAKFDVSQYPHPTREQRQAMMQQLLADRFKLVVHHATREFPLYDLVVAKNGSKLAEAKPADVERSHLDGAAECLHSLPAHRGGHAYQGCSMRDLASSLSYIREVGRTVVDKTGLTGRYTFELDWTPEDGPASTASDAAYPALFTALKEQLGLELKPSKGPLDTIVIDHVEMPSPN
ncbi:MAG: TIGR03435 family protein [Terracidiphilus sp.]